MTENLNNIEQEQLEQSKIDEDMRYVLQNLSSDDKNLRDEALSDLINKIYHQGTLNCQSAFAVPFLQERLQYESEQELLYEILLALAHLATGRAFSETHRNVFYQDKWDTPVFQAWREDELLWVLTTREAVHKGVNIYLKLLEHDSPNVRTASAYTLSCCQPDAARSCARMRLRFHQEPEELVKASMLLCLAILSNSTPVDTAFLEEVLNSNEGDLVKLAAAIALAYVARENMSDNALEMLVHLLNQPKLFLTLSEHYELPMATAHNNLLLINFLTRLNDQHMAKVVRVLTQAWGLPHYPELLLELVFQWKTLPEGTTINDLTEAQQYAMRAIANSTSTEKEMIYGNRTLNTLRIKGRFTREKLLDFLNGERLEYDK